MRKTNKSKAVSRIVEADPADLPVISEIDKKISSTSDPREIVLLTDARAELVRQTAHAKTDSGDLSVISEIDKKISSTSDTRDISLLTQNRAELVRQNEVSMDREHKRRIERVQMRWKMGFSVGVFVVGTGMFIGGLSAGLFVLGAGLFGLYPEYVRIFLRMGKRTNGGHTGDY